MLLEQRGLPAYGTEEWTVGSAVEAFRSGKLDRVAAGHAGKH